MQNPFEVLEGRLDRLEYMIDRVLGLVKYQSAHGAAIDRSKMATRKVAAEYLEVSVGTIDNLVRSKQLKSTRVGASVRFRWQDLDSFVEKRSK